MIGYKEVFMETTAKLIPWGQAEKENWFKEQTIKRSYIEEVVSKIQHLQNVYDVVHYGTLSYNPTRYPLYFIKTRNFDKNKKTILITGGVHGYETSGVHGALGFMEIAAGKFTAKFNIVCFPCISAWGYETINRWNPLALDPNRSFHENSPAEECSNFLKAINSLGADIYAHFDLHETTDTDNTIFRPAKSQRDGKEEEFSEIPDGFYLVGDTRSPQPEFQKAIIEKVRKVTHITPPDAEGKIIGVPLEQEGVINYDKRKLFLCGGFSDAKYVTTTEVYPDSPKATPAICVDAQIAAITGGIEFLA
jgi:hypothetical protein